MNVKDAGMKATRALGNGAATVYTTGIDTGLSTGQGKQLADVEWVISAPAMNATEMPDAKTMTYSVLTAATSDLSSSPTVLMPGVIVQTGAGGVGCAAAEYRFRLPSTAGRFLGVRAAGSASGNATTATMTFEAVF